MNTSALIALIVFIGVADPAAVRQGIILFHHSHA